MTRIWISKLAASLFFIAIFCMTPTLAKSDGVTNVPPLLQMLYPNAKLNSGTISTNSNCIACHTNNSGTGSTSFRSDVADELSGVDNEADFKQAIRSAAEQKYVPKLSGFGGSNVGETLRTRFLSPAPVSLVFYHGLFMNGDPAAVTGGTLSGGNSAWSLSSNAASLLPQAGLAEGSSYTMSVTPKNSANFEPRTQTNIPNFTIQVNNVPDVTVSGITGFSTHDNAGQYSTGVLNLTDYFNDVDGDALSIVSASFQSSTLDTVTPSEVNVQSSGGAIVFETSAFDDLSAGDRATLVVEFTVSDGFDEVSNTMSFTIEGRAESGVNSSLDLEERTIEIGEDDGGTLQLDLLKDGAGQLYVDPDGDVLSVTNLRLATGSGTVPAWIEGSRVRIGDLADYNSLALGESVEIALTYDLVEDRVGDSDFPRTTIQSLLLKINGENDELTARDFDISIEESLFKEQIDLIAGAMADDPDTTDLAELRAVNFAMISSTLPLGEPESFQIASDGKNLDLIPAFSLNLSEGESGVVMVTYEITDGNTFEEVKASITITGKPENHSAGSGVYANSLRALYNLSEFQRAEQQPGACFTCHTPAIRDNLGKAKPDCSDRDDFTVYGRALCEDDNGGAFGPRLSRREGDFSPRITETGVNREVPSDLAPGSIIPTPIAVFAGRTVDGDISEIQEYLITNAARDTFEITKDGNIRTLKNLSEQSYTLEVLPINIAGSKDNSGAVRTAARGFYQTDEQGRPEPATLQISVRPAAPIANDDQFVAESGVATVLEVTANDGGGAPTELLLGSIDASNGTVELSTDKMSFIYTASNGFTGNDQFSYVSSNGNPVDNDTASVSIKVVSQGAPIASPDKVNTPMNRAVIVHVLENDKNIVTTGPGASIVEITNPPDPSKANAVVEGQAILVTPVQDGIASVELTYSVSNPLVSGENSTSAKLMVEILNFAEAGLPPVSDDPELVKVSDAFLGTCGAVSSSDRSDQTAIDLIDLCTAYASARSSGENLDQTLKALRNEEHLASIDQASAIARGLGRNLSQRIDAVRNGGVRGLDISGVAISMNGTTIPSELMEALAATLAGREATGLSSKDGVASNFDPDIGAFVTGQISIGEKDANGNSEGFDLDVASISAGIDKRISDRRLVGLSLGYSDADTVFSSGGSMKARGYQMSIYGAIEDLWRSNLVLDGFFSLGSVSYTSNRSIAFSTGGLTVDRVANAKFNGRYLNIAPRLSYTQVLGEDGDLIRDPLTDLQLRWFGSLDYLRTQIDGYTETGASGLNLRTHGGTYESLLAEIGIEASRPFYPTESTRVELFGKLSAKGELLDGKRRVTSSFATGGLDAPTFVVEEDGAKGFFGSAELGLSLALEDNKTASVRIGGDFANDDGVTSRFLSLTFATPFFGNDLFSVGLDVSRREASGSSQNRMKLEYRRSF